MRGRLLLLSFLLATGAAGLIAAGKINLPSLPWNLAALDPVPSAVKPNDKPSEPSAAQTAIEAAQAALGLDGASGDSKGGDSKDGTLGAALTEPVLDISRISPDGLSVFAGRAAPNSYVTIFEDGKPAGTTQADEQGSWSLATEHKFASLDPKLSFKADSNPPPPAQTRTASVEARQDAPGSGPAEDEIAQPQPAPASPSAEVMKTFEDIVAKAREKHAMADVNSEAKEPETAKSDDALSQNAKPESDHADTARKDLTAAAEGRATAAGTEAPTQAARAGVTVDTQQSGNASEAAGHTSIPVPIMFVYNEAEFTPEGQRAVGLLLEYVKLEHLPSIRLSGHADERGTDDYNMDLSRERLEAVAEFLREGGYTGHLELSPKGKSEPYMGVDRSKYTQETLYQLDRRVELHITR